MTDWRVILQFESATAGFASSCKRCEMAGVVLPAHISVVPCDPAAEQRAYAVHAEIERQLVGLGARVEPCGGPRAMRCMSWDEPSCEHVLVLVIGSTPLDSAYEKTARAWLQKSGGRGSVIVALIPPLEHAQVFLGGAYPVLKECTAASWGGSVDQLAATTLAAAMLDEKPGVFISYVRDEASAAAQAIHDALTHVGYRVFLDRFSGTPGRVFPHELAEAMSSMGLVVLLETSGFRGAHWTMWETAFARRYRLGPVAVNFQGSPRVRAATLRLDVPSNPILVLPPPLVDQIVEFVRTHFLTLAISRRAYFETLLRCAAQKEGGDARDIGSGVVSLDKPASNSVASALPAGVPGRLRHVTRLVQSRAAGPYLLAGEHQHLPPRDRDDLRWLASRTGVKLTGSASVYPAVRRILS